MNAFRRQKHPAWLRLTTADDDICRYRAVCIHLIRQFWMIIGRKDYTFAKYCLKFETRRLKLIFAQVWCLLPAVSKLVSECDGQARYCAGEQPEGFSGRAARSGAREAVQQRGHRCSGPRVPAGWGQDGLDRPGHTDQVLRLRGLREPAPAAAAFCSDLAAAVRLAAARDHPVVVRLGPGQHQVPHDVVSEWVLIVAGVAATSWRRG